LGEEALLASAVLSEFDELPPALDEALPTTDRPGRFARLRSLAIDTRPLRESRDFRLLWCGQAISYLGNMVTFVAVPYQLYALTGSPLQVGLLSLCDAVPLLLFSAVGGTIADRLDRRKLVLRTEAGLMVVSGLLAANAFAPTPQVWALYVLAAVATSLWAIGAPALRALMPGLVPQDQLAASRALQGIYSSTGAIVGPAVGGVLIAAAGVGATYAIDAASFVPSLAAALLIAPAPPRGAGAVGLLYAAPAVGALVAALSSGWVAHVRRQGVAVAAAIVLWGLAIAGFGLATALWLGLAMLALAGLADEYSAILRSTILFDGTPDHMRGRMQGFELAQVASTPAIGNVEAGLVASLTSLRFSIVSGGVACAVGAVAIVAAIPSLLRYDARGRVPACNATRTVPGTNG
jgi:MFS family permease